MSNLSLYVLLTMACSGHEPPLKEKPPSVEAQAPAPKGCPYESRFTSWYTVEQSAESRSEMVLLRSGASMTVQHITVCRNGAAVFLQGQDEFGDFAIRFLRANQDSFKGVMGEDLYAVEARISFDSETVPPTLTGDMDGGVTLKWRDRSEQIVGERELYFPPSGGE